MFTQQLHNSIPFKRLQHPSVSRLANVNAYSQTP